jgi:dihydroorotase
MKQCLCVLFCLLAVAHSAAAQQYELLLKGGTVIDPRNNRNGVADVAIASGKIAEVAVNIPASSAKKTIDVSGLYVVPGLVDMHSHLYAGNLVGAHAAGEFSLYPDGHTLRACTTTIADGGSSGWRNFRDFKDGVIALSKTRVFVWLNIVGLGLSGIAHSQNVADMDPQLAAKIAKEFPQTIVGFKTVQWQGKEWVNVERALEAGRLADLPLLVDFGRFWPEERPYQELVTKRLRPGDISTHMYKRDVPLFDAKGKLLPYLAEARKRGVKFDLGHGLGNFNFPIVVPAIRQGWLPDAISTDLHTDSMIHAAKSLTNLMSKVMNIGVPLQDIIRLTTWEPAQLMRKKDLGHLTPGVEADVAVLRLMKGNFGFLDIRNLRMSGSEQLECELTIRNGRVLWDLNGLAGEEFKEGAPPPSRQ